MRTSSEVPATDNPATDDPRADNLAPGKPAMVNLAADIPPDSGRPQRAELDRTPNLTGPNLTGPNLTGPNLTGPNLTRAGKGTGGCNSYWC